jgi:YHS domain-containing protein
MALARRAGKVRIVRGLKYLALTIGVAAGLAAAHAAATTERIVTDRHTGLAIGGYDPVAYFVDRAPVAGRPDFEFPYEGVVWRFRNEGNRSAFADHPETYFPRYGGHDPIALARGVALAGNPLIWLVAGERIYLFYDAQSRAAFAADPNKAMNAADERWPEVVRALTP